MPAALSSDLLEKMDAYWRAANYLTVGQIYLQDNPLLETPSQARTHQTASAWALGHYHRAQLHLCPSQPSDQRAQSEYDLCHRARPRRSGAGRA